jgi:hypothetical protein
LNVTAPSDEGRNPDAQLGLPSDCTSPALMYCCRMPPPQVQNSVGGFPAPMASWIFCLNDWFST